MIPRREGQPGTTGLASRASHRRRAQGPPHRPTGAPAWVLSPAEDTCTGWTGAETNALVLALLRVVRRTCRQLARPELVHRQAAEGLRQPRCAELYCVLRAMLLKHRERVTVSQGAQGGDDLLAFRKGRESE